jgi:hypothetical protein
MDTITNKPNVSLLRGSSFAAALAFCAFCLFGNPVNADYEGGDLADNWASISNYMQVQNGSMDIDGDDVSFLNGADGGNAVFTIDNVIYEFKYDDNFIYGKVTSEESHLPGGIEGYTTTVASFIMGGGQVFGTQALVFGQSSGEQYWGESGGNVLNGGEVRYYSGKTGDHEGDNDYQGDREEFGIAAEANGSNSFFGGLIQSYYDFENNDTFIFAIDRSLLEGSAFYFIPVVMLQQTTPGLFGLKIDEEAVVATAVPEPATLLIFGLGVPALAAARRYRRK